MNKNNLKLFGASSKWPCGRYKPYPQLALGSIRPLFPPKPQFGGVIGPANGMANSAGGPQTRPSPPLLTSCDHVNVCVAKLNEQFRSTMLITAKCGVCSASATESSLWICLMPQCFVTGCSKPDGLQLDHSQLHYQLNPTHHIQMNIQSGNVHCNKCSKMVDISSKLKFKERVDVRLLASLELSEREEIFYKKITQACIHGDLRHRTMALQTLSSNTGLRQMLPRLCMFIRDGVTVCESEQKIDKLMHLMGMVRALVENHTLSFDKYINEIVTAVGNCAVSPNLCTMPQAYDQFSLRDLASGLMADLCQISSNRVIQDIVERKFVALLQNETLPLPSHYGAIATLQKLGLNGIKENILPCISSLSRKIDWAMKGSSAEKVTAQRFRGLLLKALPPVLKSLQNPPNLNEFGSIGRYLQNEKVVSPKPSGDNNSNHTISALPPSHTLIHKPRLIQPSLGQMGEKVVSPKQVGGTSSNSKSPSSPPANTSTHQSRRLQPSPKHVVQLTAGSNNNIQNSVPSTSATPSMTDPALDCELHIFPVRDFVTNQMISHNFGGYGTIVMIFLSGTGYAHVRFSCKMEAEKCKTALNGKKVFGRVITISKARYKKESKDCDYLDYCKTVNICFTYNTGECSTVGCRRLHCCLWCFELSGIKEHHRSKFDCPLKQEGYVIHLASPKAINSSYS